MKVIVNEIDQLLDPLTSYFKKDNFTRQEVNNNPPLRSELFSRDQMNLHARQLASWHIIYHHDSPELLLKALSDNEDILFDVDELLKKSIQDKKAISPAAEWLLDNFYLIEEQIRIGKLYLPKGYSKELPKLDNGFPRVYDIAIEIISHSDGHIDIQSLTEFVSAYQAESDLTIGELWAIPIMLRLALLENLSRVAARIAVDRMDTALANKWAKQILSIAESNPKDLVLIISDMARSRPPIVSAFVAEFARKLQWKGPALTIALNWLEQHLSETENTIASMVLIENQKQAADQVSVSNSINSLRFLAKMDWREFVEMMSVVERTLRKDIHNVYREMDFYTRDDYRHRVEGIARRCDRPEREIAQIVIDLAQQSFIKDPEDPRKAHVGHYLTKSGIAQTEKAAGVRLSLRQRLWKALNNSDYQIYVITALLITIMAGGLMALKASGEGIQSWWLIIIILLLLVSVSHLALAITNWLATLLVRPKPLPKMDFSLGIPNQYRTLVVVPTLLTESLQIEKLIEDLEVRFLANRDHNLLFGLLTDFKDASSEHLPDDDELVKFAKNKIEELNRKYGSGSNEIFFLFHRPRSWNEMDKQWMGYERKRGKISDLNQLLRRNSKEDTFSVIVGSERIYTSVKYVITLDTDTQLPRDAAHKLVGLMAHPLNHAVYDEKKKRVVKGYAIVQPRIAISLHGATRSGYTHLHENDAGIDPYTLVTSDVYQDVFNEGSFIGKGIYDVDAFEKALSNRFPENRILSHDLLEGSYARCGFASDVQLYEDYPSRYSIDISRRHRWIRGDWQIANWFLPFVPSVHNGLKRNSISALSRWKIFDNLRRSLVPIALFGLLVAGWIVFTSHWFWTIAVMVIVLTPSLITSIWNLFQKPKEIPWVQHLHNATSITSRSLLQSVFTLMCMPYEAFVSIDAIGRTMWRLLISGRKLLEWNPSGSSQKKDEGLFDTFRAMWISPVLSFSILAWLIQTSSVALWPAMPFLLSWIISPAVVNLLGRPSVSAKSKLEEDQKIYLRELARKTWLFFEHLVTNEDNWLPPDNLQQYPFTVIAHRTSPTNIGLSLLANLAAYDFGYAGTSQLIERTSKTFSTMEKLERFRGHFYNWYETQDLRALSPKYISTVDSGNLAGHLLTLRQGLIAIPNQKILDRKFMTGLQDTLRITIQEISPLEVALKSALQHLHDDVVIEDFDLLSLKNHLDNLLSRYHKLVLPVVKESDASQSEWLTLFERQLNSIHQEIADSAPWLSDSIPEKFKNWNIAIEIPTLTELSQLDKKVKVELGVQLNRENSENENMWLNHFEKSVNLASTYAREQIKVLQELITQCYDFSVMDYDFLYDRSQHLLSIGYSVDVHQCDHGYYDLLASEARLSLFVAIAQGKLSQESWFVLGRRLTTAGNTPVLLSWSGSMFEYLMPELVMPTYKNTLLDEMCIGTVKKQIEYGTQHDIPWGISESCYNLVDAHLTYQYKAFGVPGLGFKSGLGLDRVIAPYATVLALMIDPQKACCNLERMKANGFEGQYGFYEAIDYTPGRLSRGQSHAIIQTFMSHHQGMNLLSLAYVLLDKPMQKRFEADLQFQTALLLLQERVPKSTGVYSVTSVNENLSTALTTSEIRVIQISNTSVPEVQLLSNGRYFVMLSNAGGGYSRWKETSLTRWREDGTCDNWGTFCYIHDRTKKSFWSTAHQPTLKQADHYESIFSQGRVEFRRRDNEIETYTEIIVSPEDDVEVRRIHLTNHSAIERSMEITSYGEVVLAASIADESHPAFSNLFVQTEIRSEQHAIICTRRPRSKDEQPPWMFHLMKVSGANSDQVSYETDRSKFIGRGYTLMHPKMIDQVHQLSNTQGSVLDPVISIQYKIMLQSGQSAVIDMVTGAGETREANQFLIDKYQDKQLRDRAFELSWTHSQVVLRQIGATEADAQVYGKLASSILYLNPALRTNPNVILKNLRGQSSLWSYSISGDLPIVLIQITDHNNISLVKQLIKAQAYWHMNGLAVDLFILNEDPGAYRQILQDQIQGLIAAIAGNSVQEKRGRIFVRPIDQVSTEDRVLLETVARVIISDMRGSLEDQVNKRPVVKAPVPKLIPEKTYPSQTRKIELPTDLQFFNGTGGFSADGKQYVIITEEKKRTPLPWINVIANPAFGTIISETGSSYTWFQNAHEYRLSPWKNDSVLDGSGEAYYLRDEESGKFWSPLGPSGFGQSAYITQHGFGYSKFTHSEDGIVSEVTVHVDKDHPVKFISLKVSNRSGRVRKLSATGYVEWVLGELRSKSIMHIVTEMNVASGALMARNSFNTEFQNYVSFFDVDHSGFTYTTDRTEFIGRNGSLQNPEAMGRTHLSGKSGAGLDACAAIQVQFVLENDKEHTIAFMMGAGNDLAEAITTVKHFQGSAAAVNSLEHVQQFWTSALEIVQVDTPDPSINILANGWLLYQVLSCRLWGRSGLYQSGGAFGFRDQLQDVLALIHTQPSLTRQQILLCASRQFKEGDVQHWWHPPAGRGVRTRCSDDFLWLPYVTSRYILMTDDTHVLDELIPFLQGRQLNTHEESYYDLPNFSGKNASLYDHCKKSIEHGLRFGEHGLPLMGSGDWNDGMNLVGIEDKGESVWLAFFLYDVLIKFKKIAALRDDHDFVDVCENQAVNLKENIRLHAWDGEWYLRAFFDDGSPLGSNANDECKMDAISQSWSVLSEAGDAHRSHTAMKAVSKNLINRTKGIIQLLDPPFDTSAMDPGYIKGYSPGVRENGGQYTHAAIWMVMAFAKQHDQAMTEELLNLINPIHHGTTPQQVDTYKVEPYVMAADVYGVDPHIGRGGWTWYTGSAGWMYQLIIESFLGLKREGNSLRFESCIPGDWKSFSVKYRFQETIYYIELNQSSDSKEEVWVDVDGERQPGETFLLINDKKDHFIKINGALVSKNKLAIDMQQHL